jgi:hypothetical protein
LVLERGHSTLQQHKNYFNLYELKFCKFSSLQRVLVSMNRHEEALVMAERACTRAFIDYLLERQAGSEGMFRNDIDPAPITCEQIVNIVGKQKSLVLCYSIAAGYLYSWLLTPDNGRLETHLTMNSQLKRKKKNPKGLRDQKE